MGLSRSSTALPFWLSLAFCHLFVALQKRLLPLFFASKGRVGEYGVHGLVEGFVGLFEVFGHVVRVIEGGQRGAGIVGPGFKDFIPP